LGAFAAPPDAALPGFEEAGFDDAALADGGGQTDGPAAAGDGAWPEDDASYGAEPLHDDAAVAAAPPSPPQQPDSSWAAGRSPEFGTIDLGVENANADALPIPADDPVPNEAAVAWTEPEAAVSDTLDLSNLPTTHALSDFPAAPSDPLEFDPTRPTSEDLEADLSNPLPDNVRPPEDGLEVLGFLDEAAKEIRPRSGRVTRYHVRRRSGKVFGPFEAGVIVKMLEDGQLLGSEEVSTDGDAWTGMSAVPTFAAAMQRLVAAPTPTTPSAARPPPALAPERPKLDMDQLAQAYGGRMAVVSVVDGEAKARARKRWLVLGAMGLCALAVVGAGASLGLTRYGAFGFRWLFPARVSSGSSEGQTVTDARAALAEDTWTGMRKARSAIEGVLARHDYPEVRATWVRSVFQEQRRWGTVPATIVTQASTALEELQVLPKGNLERLKAEIGQALLKRQPDAALALLHSAKLDADGPLLEAEAKVQKGQLAEAAQALEAAVKASPSGAAWYALGQVHLKQKKLDKAEADFESALHVSPKHLSSVLELADLALARKEPQHALDTLAPALSEPKALAPPERARALTVRGAALFSQGKPADAVVDLEEAMKLDPTSIRAKGTLARVYSALKQDEKALPLWAAAVAGEPNEPAWAAGQVQTLAALHKSEEAVAAAAKARANFPKDEQTALVVARAEELLDRASDAEDAYKAATQLDPTDLDAALGLARLYLRQRRNSDARSTLAVVTEKRPQDPRLRIGLGDLALATGDLGTAQTEFERATSLAPEMAEAWVGRARLKLEKKAWKDAQAFAEKALTLDANVPDGHLVLGTALWKLGELEPATKELESARSGGSNSRLEVTLAAVRLEKGDPDNAAALLAAVLKAEPGNPEANYWMARVHHKKADYSLALESIRAAIDRAPSRASYHYESGLILKDSGKLPEAMEAWRTAVKLDPGYADAWEAIGQGYLDVNRSKEAIAAFESALKADPQRTRILGSIGDVHFQAGKWSQAVASYQAALKADPKITSLNFRLGRAYSEQGQYDKAIGFYQKALTATPDNAQAWYHLGYAWKERGKKREAVNAFQSYLAKAPDAKDRKEIEDEIYFLSK
jgi:tetratricopeptide (TPR) repeat protein